MLHRKECGERKRRAPVWGAAMAIAGHALGGDRHLPRLNKGTRDTEGEGPTKPDGGRQARDSRRERRRDKADDACRASTGIMLWQKHARSGRCGRGRGRDRGRGSGSYLLRVGLSHRQNVCRTEGEGVVALWPTETGMCGLLFTAS